MCFLDTTCSCNIQDDDGDYEMYEEEFFRKVKKLSKFTKEELVQKAVQNNNNSKKLIKQIN